MTTGKPFIKRLGHTLVWVLVLLLTVLVLGPFLVPVPPLQGTVPPEELADPDSLFIEVNGLTVHYKLAGAGQPVFVLLHGFGSSTFSWRHVMEPFSHLGTVIAFDRPAFGLTERPLPGDWEGQSPYGTAAQVDLTLALLDRLGVRNATLVGNSAGGTIAILTALRSPERVDALVLVSPAIYETGGDSPWLRAASALPQVRHLSPLLVRFLVGRLESALPSAWHDPSRIGPDVLDGYKKPLQADNWDRAFWEFTVADREMGIETQLKDVAMPTLVIAGDDDRWVPTAQSIRLSSELPGADLAVLPNCGHVPQEECPLEFMDAVMDFLRSR